MSPVRTRGHDIRNAAVALARKGPFRTADLLRAVRHKPSRQYAALILRRLVSEGILIRAGTTRGATYALPQASGMLRPLIKRRMRTQGLQEDDVLDDIRRAAPFLDRLPPMSRQIFAYAFTEMLNNAIEHSRSPNVEVAAWKDDGNIHFIVNDFGVGVFRNVMQQRSLASEIEAIQDLLKGKTTTAPAAHSGEGIFFTAKVADELILESFEYRLRIDNTIDDIFIEKSKRRKRGTRVAFRIAMNTRRRLDEVFRRHAAEPTEATFDRSEVKVRLFTKGEYVSRSQARRLLAGLEKFRLIVLDFEGVSTVGQGFADEVFRVFGRRHPHITITGINMNEVVRFMVRRAGGLPQ